jgi:multiple sugar transport system ATP-binding protein
VAKIVLERVTKDFGSAVAVDDVSLEIADGEFMVLVGPSGCGKSTILRIIAGLEEVTAGEVFIGDRQVTDLLPKERDVAMVFQNYALYPHMTVAENIGFGLKLRRTSRDEIERKVLATAKILSLDTMLDRKPAALSGGQRQRVAMGRAMVREPKAFLMDEPLSNLDAKLRVQMRAELARTRDRLRTTTVYVTHDQVEAMTLGLVEARVEPGTVSFAGLDFPAPAGNGLRAFEGRTVILGIRPSDLEDADLRPGGGGPVLEVVPEVVEDLGTEIHVLFPVDAPPAGTDEIVAVLEDDVAGMPPGGEEQASFTASLDPRTKAEAGRPLRLAVDPAAFHFFDPDSGETVETAGADESRLVERAAERGAT